MSRARVQTTKILTKTDDYTLLTRRMLRRTTKMLKKIKNRSKQNFEDEANTDMPGGGY